MHAHRISLPHTKNYKGVYITLRGPRNSKGSNETIEHRKNSLVQLSFKLGFSCVFCFTSLFGFKTRETCTLTYSDKVTKRNAR